MEQEVIDMTNAIARDGLVFFPDFCSVVLMKFRFYHFIYKIFLILKLHEQGKMMRSNLLNYHLK